VIIEQLSTDTRREILFYHILQFQRVQIAKF